MHRIAAYLVIVISLSLVVVSCQSAVHRSYLVPGQGTGDGLKYYQQYESQQQVQPAETDTEVHE